MVIVADAIDVVERLAIPIGVVLAIVIIVSVPALRRSMSESFQAGRKARERWTKKSDRE